MIGVMSDSHDNLPLLREAVRTFNSLDCILVVHAGDFVAPFAARELADLSCPLKAVYGNCDGEKNGLRKEIKPLGEIREAPLTFRHRGLGFVLSHVPVNIESFGSSPRPDVLIFGHTHKPLIERKEGILIINPGETGGWLTGQGTVAVLDPAEKSARILRL